MKKPRAGQAWLAATTEHGIIPTRGQYQLTPEQVERLERARIGVEEFPFTFDELEIVARLVGIPYEVIKAGTYTPREVYEELLAQNMRNILAAKAAQYVRDATAAIAPAAQSETLAAILCSKSELLRALGMDPTYTKYLDQLIDGKRLEMSKVANAVGYARYLARFTDPEMHAKISAKIASDRQK